MRSTLWYISAGGRSDEGEAQGHDILRAKPDGHVAELCQAHRQRECGGERDRRHSDRGDRQHRGLSSAFDELPRAGAQTLSGVVAQRRRDSRRPSGARSRPRPPQRTRASPRRWRFLRRAAASRTPAAAALRARRARRARRRREAAAASKTSSRARSVAMRTLLAPSARCSPSSAPRCPKRIATRLAAVEHAIKQHQQRDREQAGQHGSHVSDQLVEQADVGEPQVLPCAPRSPVHGGHPRREAVQNRCS